MKLESKIYKSVDMERFFLSDHIDDYRPEDIYGYFLINDKLVPKSFVARLDDYLSGITFEYGYVWSVEKLLEDIWSSLNDSEKSVAGACILIIIENGYSIPVEDEFQIKH